SRLIDDVPLFERSGAMMDPSEIERIERRLSLHSGPYAGGFDCSVTGLLADAQAAAVVRPMDREPPRKADESAGADELGTVFHRMVASMLNRPRAKSAALRIPKEVGWFELLDQDQRVRVLEMLENFRKGELGQKIRSTQRLYPELPFIYRTSSGLLRGQIDLAFERSPGDWVIVDYKTSKKDPRLNENFLAFENYRRQIGIYSWIFSRLCSVRSIASCLYFPLFGYTHEENYDQKKLDDIKNLIYLLHARKAAEQVASAAGPIFVRAQDLSDPDRED
ncbi:MAG: PD-(D/E)XK nuclease family protein, partial [Candidatus Omnitrophota bacterium]